MLNIGNNELLKSLQAINGKKHANSDDILPQADRQRENNIGADQPSSWSEAVAFFLRKGKREKLKSKFLDIFPLNCWAIILKYTNDPLWHYLYSSTPAAVKFGLSLYWVLLWWWWWFQMTDHSASLFPSIHNWQKDRWRPELGAAQPHTSPASHLIAKH